MLNGDSEIVISSRFVNCEDAYSKFVKVVTVADVSDEDRIGNSLLQIWLLKFGHKT